MALLQPQRSHGIGMVPISPNQGVHRIQSRVPKESNPEFKIADHSTPSRFIDISARLFPKASPPKSGFLHDVPIGACQETKPRPSPITGEDESRALVAVTCG